jgi:hypothetical protein
VDELNEAPEQETTEELEVPAGDAVEPSTEADPFEDGADSFDRAYVERLRKESASYRTKAKEHEAYAKSFEPYGEEDRAVWNEAMRLFAEDPKAGAEYLDKIAKAVMSGYEKEQAEQDAPITDENDKPLTRAEYNSLREAERVQAQQDAEVARIEKEAVTLGYDPKSDEYTYLLTVASRLPSGSINEAHAKIEAAHQARIDAFVASKAADADSAAAPPAEDGGGPSGETQIRTFKDARAAALARVAATR